MNRKHILGHIIFWIIIMSTYALSEWGYRDNFEQAVYFELLYLPVRLIAVYVNWFYLLPVLLFRNYVVRYLLVLIGLLFLLGTVQQLINVYWGYPVLFPEWYPGQKQQPLVLFRIVQNLVIIVSPVAFSTGIKLFINWYEQKNRTSALEIEKTAAELKYLKGQVNPHFLFNILNNIYGLAKEKSDKVPDLILKLSDFLSFSIYESEKDFIPMEKELKLMCDFIDLEKNRYGRKVSVKMAIDDTLAEQEIVPMTFVTLVENAFKYGVREEIGNAEIEIQLTRQSNGVFFEVINTTPNDIVISEPSGLGLQNLRRRLDLTYPGRYELSNMQVNNFYIARLLIKSKSSV